MRVNHGDARGLQNIAKHLILTSRKPDILQAPVQTDHLARHQVELVHL